jgi:integrase
MILGKCALPDSLVGLRRRELIALQWKDLDFNSKVILVQNSETFTIKAKPYNEHE